MNKIGLVYDWLDELATRPQLIREHYTDSEISSFAKNGVGCAEKAKLDSGHGEIAKEHG